MYVNGKIRAAENILGIREINENDGRGKFKYDIHDILKELLQMS
jgi:hypothetical protein